MNSMLGITGIQPGNRFNSKEKSMQAQKEQIDSTSKFMKESFGDGVLTKDPQNRHERRKDEALSRSKRKKHKKKRSKSKV